MPISKLFWRTLLVVFAFSWLSSPLDATEPEIRNLNVRGLQIGGTTALIVDGDDLGTAPRLLLPFAATAKLKPGSAANRALFDVTLDGNVSPGFYSLRVVTDGGVSLPVVIGVDRLPQLPLAAAIEQLPSAVHGAASGTVETRFAGKAGHKVLVEVEAQRLSSKLRPVVHLYSPRHLQVAWSWPTPALAGDTRLEATLPEDGAYTIAVHDVEYATPGAGFFRLKVGQWSFVDQVFPPVIGKGPQTVELLGPSAPVRVEASTPSPPTPLPRGEREDIWPLAWPKEGLWSGPRPFVVISSRPELVEGPAAEKGQELPAGPVGVSGRLSKPYEQDRYRVPVQPGSKVRLEVFAERLGSPLDAELIILNEAGSPLAAGLDATGTLDPVLEYAVPEKVTSILVAVADAHGRGGSRGIYRLAVDPQPLVAGKDFRLFTAAQRIALPLGGRAVVPVLIERRGYQGGVELSATGLPAGIKLESATIPPGADGALVTVQRGESPGDAAVTGWRGRSEDGQERAVAVKGHPLERLQPWLATDLPVAPTTGKAADFQIDWRGLSADAGLVPARKLVLPVKLSGPSTNTAVRLTLVTSQLPPLVNNQPDPNQTLRPEKPVELAAKVAEGDVTLLVPPQLSAPVYDVTVHAELLGPDKRTVLASAYAPVRRMAVRLPLVIQVDGPASLEARLDPKIGATFEIKGKVERREGLTGDVTVSLTGLPVGGRADAITVKAGATAFAVKVVLPSNVPVGEIKGLKLSGTVAPDPKLPNVRVRSREVELTLVVQAPAK